MRREPLHHARERVGRVCNRVGELSLGDGQEIGPRGIIAKAGPQRDEIHVVADARPVSGRAQAHRHAEPDLVLAGEAAQERLEAGGEHGDQRDVPGPRDLRESSRDRGLDAQTDPSRCRIAYGWPGPIRRQGQRGRGRRQPALPECLETFTVRPCEQRRLGTGEVRVGRRRARDRAPELARQVRERGKIGGRVVHDQKERADAGAPTQERDAQRRPRGEIEAAMGLLDEKRRDLRLGPSRGVDLRPRQLGLAGHAGARAASLGNEPGPQRRVTLDSGLEVDAEPGRRSLVELDRAGDVVQPVGFGERLDEPQRLLASSGRVLGDVPRGGRRSPVRRRCRGDEGERSSSSEQGIERDVDAIALAHISLQLDSLQRIEPVPGQHLCGIDGMGRDAEVRGDDGGQRLGSQRSAGVRLRHGSIGRLLLTRATPGEEDIELAGENGLPPRGPLQLSAGGLWHRSLRQERDECRPHCMLGREGLADGGGDGFEIGDATRIDLAGEGELLLAILLDRERGAAAGAYTGVSALRGVLEILRIVVAPAEDDEVLAPSRDHEIAGRVEEAEITGAQIRLRIARDRGPEGHLGERWIAPVSLGHARSRDPDLADLADLARGPGDTGFGVHDAESVIADHLATADEMLRRCTWRRFHRAAALQSLGLDGHGAWGRFGIDSRDDQRRLGEAIAGKEGRLAEAAGSERIGEATEGRCPDRLGAGERYRPCTEIESGALLGGHLAQAQLVGEVRAAADRSPEGRYPLQPALRSREEVHRRHQQRRKAPVDRLEDAADEAHVVIRRQPDHAAAGFAATECGVNRSRVGEQVSMREHHALGRSGRARGVLQERQLLAVLRGWAPRGGVGLGVVDSEPVWPGETRHRGEQPPLRDLAERAGGEHRSHLGIVGHCRQASQITLRAGQIRRVRRDRDHAGIDAPEERGDVIEARGKQEEHTSAGL